MCDLGLIGPQWHGISVGLGKLIELVRRSRKLTMVELADQAGIYVAELYSLEHGLDWSGEPRTIYQLSGVLKLPFELLQELSGLVEPRSPMLQEEAIRFAAKSESTAELTPDERKALEAFVRVLAGKTDEARGDNSD